MGRERTGFGAVEREGEIGNGCVCLVPRGAQRAPLEP